MKMCLSFYADFDVFYLKTHIKLPVHLVKEL